MMSAPSVAAADLQKALTRFNAGRLDKAEALYRRVLDWHGDPPDALHILGVIALRRGRDFAAVDLRRRAVSVRPANPLYHYNLGIAQTGCGRLPEGVAALREATRLKPDLAPAWSDLCHALTLVDRYDEAIRAGLEAVWLAPFQPLRDGLAAFCREEKGRDHR